MPTAIVTGGTSPVAATITRRLNEDGWRVVLADRDETALKLAAENTAASGFAAFDPNDVEAARSSVARVEIEHGPIRALVNAAGDREGANAGSFCSSSPEQWRAIIDTQLRSVIVMNHVVIPRLAASGGGAIVSIAAFEALRGSPHGAVYSTAKAGVVVLTQTLVRECKALNIRVNTVLPRPVDRGDERAEDNLLATAEAVAYLLSDRARWTTGACLDVTDGIALH